MVVHCSNVVGIERFNNNLKRMRIPLRKWINFFLKSFIVELKVNIDKWFWKCPFYSDAVTG